MLAKIQTYSNFGSLNPNLTRVFSYDNSMANFRVANFSVSSNPEIGNTVAVGENQLSSFCIGAGCNFRIFCIFRHRVSFHH